MPFEFNWLLFLVRLKLALTVNKDNLSRSLAYPDVSMLFHSQIYIICFRTGSPSNHSFILAPSSRNINFVYRDLSTLQIIFILCIRIFFQKHLLFHISYNFFFYLLQRNMLKTCLLIFKVIFPQAILGIPAKFVTMSVNTFLHWFVLEGFNDW